MVVIDGFPDVNVGIRIGNASANAAEYADPDPDLQSDGVPSLSRSTYIESVANAEFAIAYRFTQKATASRYVNGTCFTFKFFVDGTVVDSMICRPHDFKDGVMEGSCKGRQELVSANNTVNLRKFRFSSVTTVDEATSDRLKSDIETAKSLGLIRVDVHLKRPLAETDWSLHRNAVGNPALELYEKALKGRAISHGTTFSNAEVIPKTTRISVEDMNGGKPIASFFFKYRSNEALRAELIVPRTPSPEAEPRAPSNSGENKAEVKRRVKSEVRTNVKREASQVYDLTGDDLPERKPKRFRRGEVIDLTIEE